MISSRSCWDGSVGVGVGPVGARAHDPIGQKGQVVVGIEIVGAPQPETKSQNGRGIRARAQAAASSVTGAGPIISNGAQTLETKVEQPLDSSQYGQAFGYLRELQRIAVYGIRAPQAVQAVGQKLVNSGRIPDMTPNLPIKGTTTIVRVFADVKFWRAATLAKNGPADKLAEQVTRFLSEDRDSKVMLDFVETAVDPTTDAQTVLNALAGRGVDISRVGVRIAGNPNTVTTLPATAWNAGVVP